MKGWGHIYPVHSGLEFNTRNSPHPLAKWLTSWTMDLCCAFHPFTWDCTTNLLAMLFVNLNLIWPESQNVHAFFCKVSAAYYRYYLLPSVAVMEMQDHPIPKQHLYAVGETTADERINFETSSESLLHTEFIWTLQIRVFQFTWGVHLGGNSSLLKTVP